MTTTLTEQQLAFTFAEGVEASRYDDWVFYRSQFVNALIGCWSGRMMMTRWSGSKGQYEH